MIQLNYILNYFKGYLTKLPGKTLLILICIMIGIVAGISAFLLKSLLQYVHHLVKVVDNQSLSNLLRFVLPITGLLLTVAYIRIFHPKGLQKGISPIIDSIHNKSSIIDVRQTYGHIFSSSLTIGLGGSAGFEAPIVATGSAIGSNIARYFKFNKNERAILLASGAAAGISGVFNAPIAGVLFAIEVLLVDMVVTAFIPLLLASASAAIVSRILFQGQLFVLITSGWNLNAIPIYIVLGSVAGLYSVLIIRQTIKTNIFFSSIRNKWLKALLGGLILSVMIFVFPSLFGEGYFTIQEVLDMKTVSILNDGLLLVKDHYFLLTIALLLIAKIYATSITISAGGNGGIFAPSVFMGGFLGFFVSSLINVTGIVSLNVINFTVVGVNSGPS